MLHVSVFHSLLYVIKFWFWIMGCGLWKSELGSVVKNQEPITKNHQPKLLLLSHAIQFSHSSAQGV